MVQSRRLTATECSPQRITESRVLYTSAGRSTGVDTAGTLRCKPQLPKAGRFRSSRIWEAVGVERPDGAEGREVEPRLPECSRLPEPEVRDRTPPSRDESGLGEKR
jgi:hypothetical protein